MAYIFNTAYLRSFGDKSCHPAPEVLMRNGPIKSNPRAVGDERRADPLSQFRNTFFPRQPQPEHGQPGNTYASTVVCSIRKEDVQIKKSRFKGVERKLGEGAYGTVYKGRLDGLSESVVLKQFHTGGDVAMEAKVLKYLGATGYVPQCLGTVDSDRPMIVQENLKGYQPLFQLHRSPTKLTSKQWMKVALEMARGIQRIHDRGVLHNDIKGDNIMVDISDRNNPKVKFIDFGNAVFTQCGSMKYNFDEASDVPPPRYLAPEVREGQMTTRASDIYSLGRCLYRAGKSAKSNALTVLALKCLEKDPHDRPKAANIVSELETRTLAMSSVHRTIREPRRCC